MAVIFPLMVNFHAKISLKKILETIEEFTSIMAKEAEDLKELCLRAAENDLLTVKSSVTIVMESSKSGGLEEDILAIFFSPEVKELGRKRKTSFDYADASFESEKIEEDIAEEVESMTAPVYRVWEGMPSPEIEEHMHPDAEMEFLSTFRVRGPLSSYLEKTELPQDLQRASKWMSHYLTTVGKILLAKVKEIETGLSLQVLKERGEEEGLHRSSLGRPVSSLLKDSSTAKNLLAQYMSSKRIKFSQSKVIGGHASKPTSKEREKADLAIAGFLKDQVAEEEETEDDLDESYDNFGQPRTSRPSEYPLSDDSPFNAPKTESPEEMEAFGELVRQIDLGHTTLKKIKLQHDLSPQYIVQKTAQVIQQNNLIQLENTALEIALSKLHVSLNFEKVPGVETLQPTWGHILCNLLFQMHIYKKENASTSLKETSRSMDVGSSDTKQTPSQSVSTSVPDTDTTDSVSGYELGRYMYTPPTEVISFEPLTLNHFFGVKPPYYRFMPIEEAVKRADEKRDLSKRIHQVKKEILRTFSKEPESESDSDDGEESGWRKWLSYERRQDLVNNAIDGLILLNEALHQQSLVTLRELEARKDNIQREAVEKSTYAKELITMEKIKNTPREKRLPSQRKWSDVLFKTMKSYLATDLKTKNLMLAHQRTLSNKIAELTKTVRHIEQLEKKTDWGDLALQRLQFNSAHRRNITIDEDINQLKKLNATYTLKLIHAREELDAKVRENRNLVKHRDLSVKKKNAHKEAYMVQHKKLVTVQESLKEAPKVSDVERFVIQARTEEYKKKKMKQYQTELEVREAYKKVKYLKSRIEGLGMEFESVKRLKESHRKIVRTQKLMAALEKYCKEAEKNEFGLRVEKLEPPEFLLHKDKGT